MDTWASLQQRLSRVQFLAFVVGGIAAVVCAVAYFMSDHYKLQFFRSYLFAYLFWLGLPLGCMSVLMVHHLTGGRWGFAIRRFLEAGIATIPVLAILFVPLLFGTHLLYEWADEQHLLHDPVLAKKKPYLNLDFYHTRVAIYFATWILVGLVLNAWSMRRDRNADFRLSKRLQLFSGPAILAYALTMTFASVDWGMSLEPHWFSTIYGVIFMIGYALSALAFVTIVAVQVHAYQPFSGRLPINVFHDLGNMLLAAVMLWAYVAFSQYLIIWSGNLPEETPWYIRRSIGGWRVMALAIIVFHFFVPFLLLLVRVTKRDPRTLLVIASGLLIMRFVDMYWTIAPAFLHEGISAHWLDAAATIAVGGLWLAAFCWRLKARGAVPVLLDPHESVVSHHELATQKTAG